MPNATFELETSDLEESLSLLERRENDAANAPPRDAPLLRRAVCVEALLDQTASRYGLPFRTRYVVAAFAYGEDLVTFKSVTSRSAEMGPPADDERELAAAQRRRYAEVLGTIRERLGEMGASDRVPLVEGTLRHSAGGVADGPPLHKRAVSRSRSRERPSQEGRRGNGSEALEEVLAAAGTWW